MSKTIQLPDAVPEFKKKTLIACLSHHGAVFYTGEGNTITGPEEFESVVSEYEYSDKEGFDFSRVGTRGHVPGNDEHNKEHSQRVFLNELAEKLRSYHQAGILKMIVFTPEEIKNAVEEKLPAEIRDITELHAGILTKEPPLKLLERIRA